MRCFFRCFPSPNFQWKLPCNEEKFKAWDDLGFSGSADLPLKRNSAWPSKHNKDPRLLVVPPTDNYSTLLAPTTHTMGGGKYHWRGWDQRMASLHCSFMFRVNYFIPLQLNLQGIKHQSFCEVGSGRCSLRDISLQVPFLLSNQWWTATMFSKHHPSVWPHGPHHHHHLQIDQLARSLLLSPRDLSILIFLLQIEPPNSSLSSLLLPPPLQFQSVTLSATLWLLPTETLLHLRSERLSKCLQPGMTGEMDGIKRCLANVTYFKTLLALSFSKPIPVYLICDAVHFTNMVHLKDQVWQRTPSWNWKTPAAKISPNCQHVSLHEVKKNPINRGHWIAKQNNASIIFFGESLKQSQTYNTFVLSDSPPIWTI